MPAEQAAGALALGLGMLALTGLAVLQQPGHVVRPLPVILRAYREADELRIAARDM